MSTTTDRSSNTTSSATTSEQSQRKSTGEMLHPTRDVVNYVRKYARQKPDVAALWCLGLGIVVGWKIKPW